MTLFRTLFRRHPGFLELGSYMDEQCSAETANSVRAHLRECARCRNEVKFLRRLRDTARQIPSPRPPEGILERILERRESGERLLLPTEGPVHLPSSSPFRRAGIGVGMVLLLLAGFFILRPAAEAGAETSELKLAPPRPTAGEEIQVAYRPSSRFAGRPGLSLRARYRRPEDGPETRSLRQTVVASLEKGEDGLFRGSFRLPPKVVYALFAVEDSAGEEVDAHGGRLWEILVRDRTGRPLLSALRQRELEWEEASEDLAYETARQIVEYYPNRADGWVDLFRLESRRSGGRALDSLRAVHLARLRALDRSAAQRAAVPPDEMAALAFYARFLGKREVAGRWARRLLREHPDHPQAVQLRVTELVRTLGKDPAALLEALERLWEDVGPAHDLLVLQGFRTALRSGRRVAILSWADRQVASLPWTGLRVATQLAGATGLREEGIERLRAEIARLAAAGDETRALYRSRVEGRMAREGRLRRVRATLAGVLEAAGRPEEALAVLDEALKGSWDAELFRHQADLRLALGDTAAALESLARAAADPAASAAFLDTVAAQVGRRFEREGLDAAVAAARREMADRTLARSVTRRPEGNALVEDGAGRPVALREMLRGRVGVVLFWSRFLPGATEALEELAQLGKRFPDDRVRTVAVTPEGPSAGLRAWLARSGQETRVRYDVNRGAARALGARGSPLFVVLDARGFIRFADAEPEELAVDVAALRAERAVLAAAR
ncbi:MAG: redoxin domain-containing protein [Gemmatimonadota bacterium]